MSAGLKAASDGLSATIQVGGVDKAIIGESGLAPQIFPISASVGSNALTITLNPCCITFRSATLGSGATNTRSVPSAITVVVPSSATLGTINATQSRLAVIALDNAGTVELAVVNIAGGNDLSETGLISTTAISASATSASTIYSTTARTNVAYRVIGYVESTQATAGTWATAPSTIQGAGGNAVTSMQSFGNGQTWQNVLGSRVSGTTYYNTTGKTIFVCVGISTGSIASSVNGVSVSNGTQYGNYFPVPPGASYVVTATLGFWAELR